jgi:MFS family permease
VLLFVGSALGAVCLLLATAHAMLVFLFAFAALRVLGQGSLPVNGTLLIAQWFSRYRARAVAVMSLGFAVATAVLPPVSRLVIESYGWREAYAVLGVMVWVLILPGSFFLVRNTPEEVGLLPDGEEVSSGRRVETPTVSGPDKRRVFTSTTFWALALPLATPSLVVTAMVFHQTGIFEERGLSATTAGAVFVPFAISSAVSAVAGGFLIDRYGPRPVFVGSMALLLAALGWLQFVDSVPEALLYGAILGASGALAQTIGGVIWAHFYGRERLGRIQGSGMMVGIAGAALGPLPLALLESAFDGFGPGLLALSVLPVIAIVVISLARPVRTESLQEA